MKFLISLCFGLLVLILGRLVDRGCGSPQVAEPEFKNLLQPDVDRTVRFAVRDHQFKTLHHMITIVTLFPSFVIVF